MRLRLIPDETSFDFMRIRMAAVGVSLAAIVASLILVFTMGLNFGIDFRGGIMIEARTQAPAEIGEIRDAVSDLGLGEEVAVQSFGQPNDVLIRVGAQEGDGDRQMEVAQTVQNGLEQAFAGIEIRRVEVVGPKVSGELIQQGALAIGLAVLAIMVYVWLRFEWQFSVGAVVALVHDVLLTIGVFSVLQLEFNLAIVAALLTIVGYSINDTVIVYDRVRENLRKYKQTDLTEVLNLSVNETLSRTVMTSGTTLLALSALYFLGGEVIRGFTFAMIWGILVGTYSSIFVAAVALIRLGVKRDWSKPDKPAGTQFGAQV